METGMPDKKRLIVIVPGQLADNFRLAADIHTIACKVDADVLYLVLASDREKMLELSGHMKTMRAVTMGTWIIVVSDVADLATWRKPLQKIYHSHDLITIASEQNVVSGQLRPVPVIDFLSAPLKQPTQPIFKDGFNFSAKSKWFIAKPRGVPSKNL
jgi:hypothetical protein